MKKTFFLLLYVYFCQYSFATTYHKYLTVGQTLNVNSSFTGRFYYYSFMTSDEDVARCTYTSTEKGNYPNTSYSFKGVITALNVGVATVTLSYSYQKNLSSNSTSVNDTYIINVVDVTAITLPNSISLSIGDNYTFSPLITHSEATTSLTWHSSNSSVATINSNGQLNTVGIGNTTIICTASNGVSAQCLVTVNPVLATSIVINQTTSELITGEELQLSATVLPSNTTNKNVTWSSTNTAVATVDDDGKVTAIGVGQCNIVATTVDGSNKTSVCQITVPNDVLYVDNAVGVPSGTLVLPIQLSNTSSITGLQFELQLPEGISVAKDGAEKFITTLSDRAQDQSINCSLLSNGNYQFVVFSPTSSELSGNDGAIGYVTLNVSEDMATGEYPIVIKEVELTKTSGESLHHKDITSKITLTEAISGDINGDGKITITDAVGIVNHVLHRTPSIFITKAADVNGDGNISISDAVSIVNIVLNK